MNRITIIYVAALLVLGVSIGVILEQGGQLEAGRAGTVASRVPGKAPQPSSAARLGGGTDQAVDLSLGRRPGGAAQPTDRLPAAGLRLGVVSRLEDPLSQLFLQLILIVGVSRLVGALFVKAGQPAVIGEMAAGILLGPSFFGWCWPGAFRVVFPASSLGTLQLLSQIGVCLFLFMIGMEVDLNHLRQRAPTVVLVSHVSIVLPYFLGVLLSLFLFTDLAAPGARFAPFALFLGICLSITAFPVLARILEERALSHSSLGTLAITCAAVGDVTAWIILALVVAVVQASGLASFLVRVVLVLIFVGLMLTVVRPRLARWFRFESRARAAPGQGVIAGMLILVLAAALATELIGIHALFGAFVAGTAMPRHSALRDFLRVRLENFSSTFLLPLFFAFTGLRAQVGLLNDLAGWAICLGIIAVATLGKLGGSMLAARVSGSSWSEGFALGVLMNTRGLMELIALNLGYDLGILSARIFAMLVIMALFTTGLTGPLLTVAQGWQGRDALDPEPRQSPSCG